MFSRNINSNRIFPLTNNTIKMDHIYIERIFPIKAGPNDYHNHYISPEEDIKAETRVKHNDNFFFNIIYIYK